MIIPFYEELLFKKSTVDLVNSEDEELKRLGLLPLFLTIEPLYITPNGKIYFYTTDHTGANIKRNYDNCLDYITETSQRDYIKKENRFSIVNSYWDEMVSSAVAIFSIFQNNILIDRSHRDEYINVLPMLLDELEKYIGHKLNIINVEDKLVYFDESTKVKTNILAQDYFFFKKKRILDMLNIYKDSYNFTGCDVRELINWVPNVFPFGKKIDPFDYHGTRGLFNDSVLKIANGIRLSKLYIYNFFENLCRTSTNPMEALESLNKLLNRNDMFVDMLIMAMDFDKVETQLSRTISTSKTNVYESFFNYFIMGFNIMTLPKIVFRRDENMFDMVYPKDLFRTDREYELEEEVQLIKRKVPYEERYRFLK